MGDILEIIANLQQNLQRGDLTLPDISTCTGIAIRKLNVLHTAPYPGKRESNMIKTKETAEIQEGRLIS